MKTWQDKVKEWKLDIFSFLEDKNFLTEMTENERKEFLFSASQIYLNKTFEIVIKDMINNLGSMSMTKSPNTESIMFDRGGINALYALWERFKGFNTEYKETLNKTDRFDKYNPL